MNYLLLKGKERFLDNEFLGIDIFDKDFHKLLFLLIINIVVSFIIVRVVYYPHSEKKREYLFAFMTISTVVFFLGFALKKFEFNTGIALGLFAVFGIIRFRTSPMPIKEMAYFFALMGVSLINALSNKLSLMEVGVIDGVVILLTFLMEVFMKGGEAATVLVEKPTDKKIKEVVSSGVVSKDMVYGLLENVKPANREKLIADLKQKTGLDVMKVEAKTINLKRGEALLKVYYNQPDEY